MTSLTDSLPLDEEDDGAEGGASLHEFQEARQNLQRSVSQEESLGEM